MTFDLKDYCELVDSTGRYIHDRKSGVFDDNQNPILMRLGLNSVQWLTLTTELEKHFYYAAGAEQTMHAFKRYTQYRNYQGWTKHDCSLKGVNSAITLRQRTLILLAPSLAPYL